MDGYNVPLRSRPECCRGGARAVISIFGCAALAFIPSTIIQGTQSRGCTLQTSRRLWPAINAAVSLAEETPASAARVNLPPWVSVCSSERSFHASVWVCVLQVSRCAPWQRELPTDRPAALWPHLHRLSRPAADEATHGSLAQETQVSGMHTEPEGVAVLCTLPYH